MARDAREWDRLSRAPAAAIGGAQFSVQTVWWAINFLFVLRSATAAVKLRSMLAAGAESGGSFAYRDSRGRKEPPPAFSGLKGGKS